ncbi:hypothetical protein QOZ80_5AG0367830 [Eleusine coracana subsp. coracana]|nr:hypothetical protein QOZ80_5AG0367830 [Eleusine coracana subsp. coracana]
MASDSSKPSKKLRILLVPFLAASHIGPFTDLAFHLAAARPGAVEATVAVTHANASVVRSALARRDPNTCADDVAAVHVATYAFPAAAGLPPGVENLSTVTAADAWRIDASATDEALMRPGQERLVRALSPDAVVTDAHFFWNVDVAASLGAPCVTFHVIGTFATQAMFKLLLGGVHGVTDDAVTVPGFPGPEIRVPVTELPEFMRTERTFDRVTGERMRLATKRCLGLAVNTFADLERGYCEMYARNDDFAKRAYFLGPLALPLASSAGESTKNDDSGCIRWLDTNPGQSVVYLCFGSLTHVSEAQLSELALGLEASGKPFLGAVGAFVTHCGWNSVLETVAAGVPVMTWPMVVEQFVTERFVTEVLKIGERVVPEGAGLMRSTRSEENELVPAKVVAQAVSKFMGPGGAGDAARSRVKELSAKAKAAMAAGGSSHRDLHRLIDDLMEVRAAASGKIRI